MLSFDRFKKEKKSALRYAHDTDSERKIKDFVDRLVEEKIKKKTDHPLQGDRKDSDLHDETLKIRITIQRYNHQTDTEV